MEKNWSKKRGAARFETPSGDAANGRGPLLVDVCGIAMFIPDVNQLYVVDGRQPRIAVTDGSLISPHVPLLGIETDSYEPTTAGAKLMFNYDIDGIDQPLQFDGFVLDRHTIRFRGVMKNSPTLGGPKMASMSLLSQTIELCPSVRAGNSQQVVGTVDFSNALWVNGKTHGKHEGPLTFGHKEIDCADMAIATFEVGSDQPAIEMVKNGVVEASLKLRGDGPWRVMVGNFPMDELIGTAPPVLLHEVPLTHLELYYDLYHVSSNDKITVPVGDNHVHSIARTANGRCGPTMTP